MMPAVRLPHVRAMMSERLVPCLDWLKAPFSAVVEKFVGSEMTALR